MSNLEKTLVLLPGALIAFILVFGILNAIFELATCKSRRFIDMGPRMGLVCSDNLYVRKK